MAIALRGSASNRSAVGSGSAPASVTYPAGVVAGDLVILTLNTSVAADSALTTPTNYTLEWDLNTGVAAVQDCQGFGYYRVATGSLSGSVSMSYGTTGSWVATMMVFSGVDTTTPFIARNSNTSTASSTSIVSPTVVNTDPSAAIVFFAAMNDAVNSSATVTETTTNSATLLETVELATTQATPRSLVAMQAYALNAGATSSTATATFSKTSTDKLSWLAFLNPAPPSIDNEIFQYDFTANHMAANW